MTSFQLSIIVSYLYFILMYAQTVKNGLNIIPKNYNKALSPMTKATTSTRGVVDVTMVTIGIKNHWITDVCIKNMNIQIDLLIYMYWWDPRLVVGELSSSTALPQSVASQLWTPRVKLKNCIGCRESLIQTSELGCTPNDFIVVDKNIIFTTIRKKFTLACKFDLSNYPFDKFPCGIEFETLAAEQRNPIKLFTDVTYQAPNNIDNVVVQSGFQVVSRAQRSCSGSNLTFAVTNNCLEELIVIRRLIASYILGTFIPSMFLVIISWISFWLPVEMITAKLIICFVPLFSVVTLYTSTKLDSPEMSSFKAIDLWMFTCICFIFFSILQLGIVSHLYERQIANIPVTPLHLSLNRYNLRPKSIKTKVSATNRIAGEKAAKLDKPARILFPVLFIIFNITFWAFYW